MDNTQKPGSPPTFDPMSPPTPPPASPPASQRGELGGPPPTFPQEPLPPIPPVTAPSFNPPPPVAPPWPPAPEPIPASPLPPPTPDLSSSWTPTPPPPPPPPSDTSTSPLDNPWSAPPQAPPINTPSIPPSWTPPQTPIETSESPPTDLSHLVGNNPRPEPTPTNLNQAETLVVPPAVIPESSAEPSDNVKRGVPKWLIGVGAGFLIVVLGASAYFIMGIGQTPKNTSLPAVDTTQTSREVKPPAPIATPPAQTPAPADNSASFGQLQGGGGQATSAGDLLRRQGR